MATDFISREAMHKANQDEWQGVYGFVDCDIFEDNENMIDRVPAADVVEVVRCRDCRYDHACLTQQFVEENSKIPFNLDEFFCPDGKRRESE